MHPVVVIMLLIVGLCIGMLLSALIIAGSNTDVWNEGYQAGLRAGREDKEI